MARRNYQGVMQNDPNNPNLMWHLGPMFQGVSAMSDRRHSMNRQRRQNYIQDRMDMETLAMIEPEYKKQENLILRRTIVQQTTQRTSTIYTEQTAGAYGSGFLQGGGQF